MSFKHEMNAKVSNSAGDVGTVIGRAEYADGGRAYLFLREGDQHTPDKPQGKWTDESDLTAA